MGKGGGAPAAPDYKGAAEAQAMSQRVNQVTPFGSLTWSQGTPTVPGAPSTTPQGLPATPAAPVPQQPSSPFDWMAGAAGGNGAPVQYAGFPTAPAAPAAPGPNDAPWTTTMTLSPELQQAATGMQQQVANTYSQPFDMGGVEDIYNKAYGAQTARLDPYWEQQQESQRQTLANQGIGLGSEAYTNAMRDFNQGRNDAYQQAQLAAIQTMPQTYQLGESAYTLPLNLLNSFRTGAQVGGSPTGPATNYTGAADAAGNYASDVFNFNQQKQNANTQAAVGIASAIAMAY